MMITKRLWLCLALASLAGPSHAGTVSESITIVTNGLNPQAGECDGVLIQLKASPTVAQIKSLQKIFDNDGSGYCMINQINNPVICATCVNVKVTYPGSQ